MKTTVTIALAAAALMLQSCMPSQYPVGAIYTEVVDPHDATNNGGGSKVGKAEATSILNLVATGDASIAAAKANGGISTVTSVDVARKSILGIISTYTTTVRGN